MFASKNASFLQNQVVKASFFQTLKWTFMRCRKRDVFATYVSTSKSFNFWNMIFKWTTFKREKVVFISWMALWNRILKFLSPSRVRKFKKRIFGRPFDESCSYKEDYIVIRVSISGKWSLEVSNFQKWKLQYDCYMFWKVPNFDDEEKCHFLKVC